MELIYCLISDDCWEDMIIYLSKEEAIEASTNNPNCRVEIFRKEKDNSVLVKGYSPTYNYYKNGEYIEKD